jgi:hypothetical protein
MPPSKLAESDKQDILNLYRHHQETTTTLASRYGVSNSTIIRVLKSFLGLEEYEALVQRNRAGRGELTKEIPQLKSNGDSVSHLPSVQLAQDAQDVVRASELPKKKPLEKKKLLTRQPNASVTTGRSYKPTHSRPQKSTADLQQLPLLALEQDSEAAVEMQIDTTEGIQARSIDTNPVLAPSTARMTALETEILSEIKHEKPLVSDEEAFDEDEDLDDELDDDYDEDDFEDESTDESFNVPVLSGSALEVLPLAENSLPRTCYLVIDRTAELVTRLLKDFGELGQIPDEEGQHRILPIFENHRIARRFSNRNQRIIKIPDARILSKAASHLQAKGITRLLIDGQVYALAKP